MIDIRHIDEHFMVHSPDGREKSESKVFGADASEKVRQIGFVVGTSRTKMKMKIGVGNKISTSLCALNYARRFNDSTGIGRDDNYQSSKS